MSWPDDFAMQLAIALAASGVTALLGFIIHRLEFERTVSSLVSGLSRGELNTKWSMTGYDITHGAEDIRYSEPLRYCGDAQIMGGRIAFRIRGELEGWAADIPSDEPPSLENRLKWKLKGRGVRDGEHLFIVYRLRHDRDADTIGCIFIKLGEARSTAEGYFLAKRAVSSEKLNKLGIAFGRVYLSKVAKIGQQDTIPGAVATR